MTIEDKKNPKDTFADYAEKKLRNLEDEKGGLEQEVTKAINEEVNLQDTKKLLGKEEKIINKIINKNTNSQDEKKSSGKESKGKEGKKEEGGAADHSAQKSFIHITKEKSGHGHLGQMILPGHGKNDKGRNHSHETPHHESMVTKITKHDNENGGHNNGGFSR